MQIGNKNGTLLAVGAAVFAIAGAASAPASLIAPLISISRTDVSYRGIEGTIWSGTSTGASVSGVPLGDIEFKLSPLSMMKLEPRLDIKLSDGAIVGQANASAGLGGRIHIHGADLQLDLIGIARRGILGAPVSGAVTIKVDEILLTRSGCQKATATVWTDILDATVRQFEQGDKFPMAGSVRCEGRNLVVALAGQGVPGDAALKFIVSPDYRYEMVATAYPAHDTVASALRYFGFEDADGALRYGAAGALMEVGS